MGSMEAFDLFDVTVSFDGDPDVADEVYQLLPPTDPSTRKPDLEYRFERCVHGEELLGFEALRSDGSLIKRSRSAQAVAQTVASELHFEIASHSTGFVFVHAGVVSWNDRAVVLPGRSMSGKSTLVQALVREGATYLSDEYAVVDASGLVHPYARALGLRNEQGVTVATPPTDLTARIGTSPVRIAVIAFLTYEPDGSWSVEDISESTAALGLIDNTVRARELPESTMKAAAVTGAALCLKGHRGDAEDAAARLIEVLEASGTD